MIGYIFTHEGKQYDPNGRVQVDDAAVHNAKVEQAELAYLATQPNSAVAYIVKDASGKLTATTWIGTEIGRVVSESMYRNNLTGSRMRHVRVNVHGAIYHGSYGCDWSMAVRLRKAKAGKPEQPQPGE